MSEEYTVRKLSPIRKIIAARMTEATQTIPHFRLTSEIELDSLISTRKALRERNPEANLSLNDLLIKACAMALMDVPAVNIQWIDGEIREFSSADISVVTALKDGLATPIVRNADKKSVWDIAREVKDLGALAAKNALKMNEVFGGSFSISNLGMFGIDQFDAIINSPQCAILAVGVAKPRLVVDADGERRVATVMRATLSIDHRALDGAIGAKFLTALKSRLEKPASLSDA
jgi:pyruvate dehydrogenase E2 component (dihydrolipoamide acetyltransferase)